MKDPMKRFVQLFVVTVFLSASLPSFAASFTGKVLSVLDGDTITILRFGKPTQVKIAEIDCPEINQSFGRKVMKFTSRMTIGKIVRVHIKHIDSYDQIIGKVILEDGRNMSHTLVRAGLAWWDFMSSRDRSLWALEKNARRKRVGLWKNKYQVPPWEFQKGLGFLIDGKTSREEVLLRLGVPS